MLSGLLLSNAPHMVAMEVWFVCCANMFTGRYLAIDVFSESIFQLSAVMTRSCILMHAKTVKFYSLCRTESKTVIFYSAWLMLAFE
jgi:hypothetical protein